MRLILIISPEAHFTVKPASRPETFSFVAAVVDSVSNRKEMGRLVTAIGSRSGEKYDDSDPESTRACARSCSPSFMIVIHVTTGEGFPSPPLLAGWQAS